MVARRRDGAGRADVQTLVAAALFGAGMGAEALLQPDIKRLLEGADRLPGLEQGGGDGIRVAGVGAKITLALLVSGEEGRTARKVEDRVALALRAVAGLGEGEDAAPAGLHLPESVHAQPEAAERARRSAQPADDNLEPAVHRQVFRRLRKQHGDGHRFGQTFRGRQRDGVPADHKAAPLGYYVHGPGPGRGEQRLGHERRLFRAGLRRFVRPSRTVPDIDQHRGRRFQLLRDLLEPRPLLLAGDNRVTRLYRLRGRGRFRCAERAVDA